MKTSQTVLTAVAVALFLAGAGAVHATDIPVANYSFASPEIIDPAFFITGQVDDWGLRFVGNYAGVNSAFSDTRVPADDQHAYLRWDDAQGAGGGIYQNPSSHQILANKIYTLTTAVKNITADRLTLSLKATGPWATAEYILAAVYLYTGYNDAFTDVSISFNSGDFPQHVGQDLYILYLLSLGDHGEIARLDNIRLRYASPPSSTDDTVAVDENTSRALTTSDFGTYNVEADPLAEVKITAPPALGTLTTNGVAVNADDVITVADLNANLLLFAPAENASGDAYTTIGFEVGDGTYFSEAYTLTVNVTPSEPIAMMAAAYVQPNASIGTVVGTVQARNPDGGTVVYAIVPGSDSGGMFAIDGASGELTLATAAGAVDEKYYVDVSATKGAEIVVQALEVTVSLEGVTGTIFLFN